MRSSARRALCYRRLMTHAARKLYRQALNLSADDRAQLTDLLVERLEKDLGAQAARLALTGALMLFEMGKVSSGRAAKLAGLGRVEFLEMCGKHEVPAFNYPSHQLEAELRADLATLEKTLT